MFSKMLPCSSGEERTVEAVGIKAPEALFVYLGCTATPEESCLSSGVSLETADNPGVAIFIP